MKDREDVHDRFEALIPPCPEFDVKKIVCSDWDEIMKVADFANDVATKICDLYSKIIDKNNSRKDHIVKIKKLVSDDNGISRYEDVDSFNEDSW